MPDNMVASETEFREYLICGHVKQIWPTMASHAIEKPHGKLPLRMNANLTRLLASALMFSSIFSPGNTRSATNQSLVDGNTQFALDLYQQLKSTPGNLFFSPYSISTCLAMTYAGARGETEKQMSRVLHFDQEQSQTHAGFGELQRQVGEAGKQKGVELNVANSLWAQKRYPFLPAFLDVAKNDYQANINQADFVAESEAVRIEINQWVEKKTKDRIRNILPRGSLDHLTRLVLLNAIYFKGIWAKPYDKSQTSIQPFHVSAARQTNVRLMHHFDEVRYAENDDFQAVELPYQGEELSMVVLLPRQIDGSGKLENQLTPALLTRALKDMRRQRVEIFLPRFKLESSIGLNDVLSKMGMPDAFSPESDFSGMDGIKFLYISGIFHKAWGEVNEEGTEAAAATAVAVAGRAISKPPPPPPVFRADRPFIFLIREVRSGSILFLGRLSEPAP
jgi:serine protease inhibitor